MFAVFSSNGVLNHFMLREIIFFAPKFVAKGYLLVLKENVVLRPVFNIMLNFIVSNKMSEVRERSSFL
jgi:hypothetical protein